MPLEHDEMETIGKGELGDALLEILQVLRGEGSGERQGEEKDDETGYFHGCLLYMSI